MTAIGDDTVLLNKINNNDNIYRDIINNPTNLKRVLNTPAIYKNIQNPELIFKSDWYQISGEFDSIIANNQNDDFIQYLLENTHYFKRINDFIFGFHRLLGFHDKRFLNYFVIWANSKHINVNGQYHFAIEELSNTTIGEKMYPKFMTTFFKILENNHKKYKLISKTLEHDKAFDDEMHLFDKEPFDDKNKTPFYEPWNGLPISQLQNETYILANLIHLAMTDDSGKHTFRNRIKSQFSFNENSAFVKIMSTLYKMRYINHIDPSGYYYHSQYVTEKLYNSIGSVWEFLKLYQWDTKIDSVFSEYKNVSPIRIGNLNMEEFLKGIPSLHRFIITTHSHYQLCKGWKIKNEEYHKVLNKEDQYGMTPIAYAILFRNINALKFLTTTSPSFIKQKRIGKRRIDYSVTVPYTRDGISLIELAHLTGDKAIIELMETKQSRFEHWKKFQRIGYHQTSEEVAHIVKDTPSQEWWFLAGEQGMFGPAIYFAETPEETTIKAIGGKGVILEGNLLLGTPLELRTFADRDSFKSNFNIGNRGEYTDVDILHYQLQCNGYDSVIAYKDPSGKPYTFMQTGSEYMVYSTEQAEFMGTVSEASTTQQGGSRTSTKRKTMQGRGVDSLVEPWVFTVRKGDLDRLKQISHETETLTQAHWLLGSTPLMIACARGHLKIVKWLLEEVKSDINETDTLGRHALFYAMRGGHSKVIQYLIEKGIDLLHSDSEGRFALHEWSVYAKEHSYRSVLLDAYYRLALEGKIDNLKTLNAITQFYKQTGRLFLPNKDVSYDEHTLNTVRQEIQRYNALEEKIKILTKVSLKRKVPRTVQTSHKTTVAQVAGKNRK